MSALEAVAAPPWRWIGLRIVLVAGLALALSMNFGRELVSLLMPLLKAALAWWAEDFSVQQFGYYSDRGQLSLGAQLLMTHTVILGGRAIVPEPGTMAVVGTTAGTVLQPLWAAAVPLLAWPGRWNELVLRWLIAAPLLVLVLCIDTPASLAGFAWRGLVREHAPAEFSPLLWWDVFLNGGGRLMLGLCVAAIGIALAQRRRPGPRAG